MLADLKCNGCDNLYYGDLPSGHGLSYPMLLNRGTGVVHGAEEAPWFARWLKESYEDRSERRVPFRTEQSGPIERPVLLNCLDGLYGHSLLKLLNAQYYLDNCPGVDLIVLVPRFLRWMVPNEVAAVWTVDLSLREGAEWNEWVASEVRRRLGSYEEKWLGKVIPHPHPDDFDISRFTRVQPFPPEQWSDWTKKPQVTLIWREDRVWDNYRSFPLHEELYLRASDWLGWAPSAISVQRDAFSSLANRLRDEVSNLQVTVTGLGTSCDFPGWVDDERVESISEETERRWCQCYAESHVVIGVHGSNMLLPSAHAGAVVDLMPSGRWGNIVQDIILEESDARMHSVRCRFPSSSSSICEIINILKSIINKQKNIRSSFLRKR